MARKLFPMADRVVLTRPASDRALPLETLLPLARNFQRNVEAIEKPGDALQYVLSRASGEDIVCVAGSLYLVGEIKKIHQNGVPPGTAGCNRD